MLKDLQTIKRSKISYFIDRGKNVRKQYDIFLWVAAALISLAACSTKKNTAASRRWHAFTARYNTYFNGKTSFDEELTNLQNNYRENYSERIFMYPISAQPKDKKETGGAFDRAIEKGNKAIKQHSISKKPQRKAGWRSDPKQVALQDKEEYNPFLKHCWMLVAQGQFYNADFLQASATFSYIARHYASEKDLVAGARIWQARCYAEMGWLYETESALNRLKENGIPTSATKEYDRVYTDFLLKSGQFEKAVPELQKVIKQEKNRRQRTRMRYLLGQIQTELGQNEAAYLTFGKVASSNPPYELEFAARIRQAEVLPPHRYQEVLKMLKRMAKSPKNKDYLDQVYTAIGNVYMIRLDTANAITNYKLGIEKSTLGGFDLAICQIKLGDIHFTQKDYVKAQPCFSGALSGIRKEYKDYDRVSRLSAALDELVVHVEAVHLQDSLQALAKLPEAERLALIDKIIEDVKEKEKEEKEAAEKDRYLAEQEGQGFDMGQRPNMQANLQALSVNSGGSSFYFYNEQTVAQGKRQFQNKWGKRVNQDDWRRRNKAMNIIAPVENQEVDEADLMQFDEEGNPIEAPLDSTQLLMDSLSSDPKSREYYLQQIPFSEEDVDASNVIIADGLFNMGMIYKDKLENKRLSVETFEELERRFPDNKYRMDYYFQSYLMGLRYKDKQLENKYKNKLIAAFPESDYAIAVSDPNYEYNIRMMDRVQDSLYETTYNRYLESDTSFVRRSYREFGKTYPLATLMPKFMFVEALTYVQAGDAEGFKKALQNLVEKYPKADVTELANEMLKGILRGRTLVKGSMAGMKWNLRFGLDEYGQLSAADSARAFVDEPETPHLMVLLYQTGAIDKNQLLYAVAAYNFANFEVKSFDLTMDEVGSFSLLIISGINSMDEALDYYKMIYGEGGYASKIDRAVSFFPLSETNYDILMHGKTLEEYMTFFAEKYGSKAPALVSRWRTQVAADEEETAREDKAVEKAADISTEENVTDERKNVPEEVVESSIEEQEKAEEQPEESPEKEKTEKEVEQSVEKEIEQPAKKETEEEETPTEETEETEQVTTPEEIPSDTSVVEQDTVLKKPKVITLEYLQKRRALSEKKERLEEEEKEKTREEKRKEAADLKKQKAKERDALRKQKSKERKERLKQKEKERKEKEKANKKRRKEKEAARKAAQKEKKAARKKR